MSYLYFATNFEHTGFKIGFSHAPNARLRNLPARFDYGKVYLFSCENTPLVEKFCHKHFNEFNISIYPTCDEGYTEWFDLSIFPLAKELLLRNKDLLTIVEHCQYQEKYRYHKPIIINEEETINDKLIKKSATVYNLTTAESLRMAHCINFNNLTYLLKNFDMFKWEPDIGRLRTTVTIREYDKLMTFLNHNRYIRDSGWFHCILRVVHNWDYGDHKVIVFGWGSISKTNILKISPLDPRNGCIMGMYEQLEEKFLKDVKPLDVTKNRK